MSHTTPMDYERVFDAVGAFLARHVRGCPHMSACQCTACELEIYDAQLAVFEAYRAAGGVLVEDPKDTEGSL